MRILIVYNSANDARSVSGVARHFQGAVKEWIAAGHTVDLLVAKAAWPVFTQLFPKSRLISSDNLFDATNYLAQTWRYFPAFAWRMLTCHWQKLPEHYDVIYACAQHIYEVYPAMRLARRQNAALAVKIHHVVNAQQGRGGFFDALYFRTERISAHWLNRFAEVIVCSTPPVENDWTLLEKQLGLVPREKPVIGYGIDLDQLSYSPSTSKQFEAVVLGRVHAHKGVFDLPEIWGVVRSRKPDARLLIVGEGPHREPLTKAFAAAGLKDAVIFTGGISDEEKNALLPQCKLGLSLSREEGWGLSITEYLAVGLPVVAMDLPIFHHVFPGVLDLTPMGNVERFADRILAWLNDSAATVAAGAQGRKFVARYDYREVARAELAVLLDGHRRHQARSAF